MFFETKEAMLPVFDSLQLNRMHWYVYKWLQYKPEERRRLWKEGHFPASNRSAQRSAYAGTSEPSVSAGVYHKINMIILFSKFFTKYSFCALLLSVNV